MRIVNLIQFKSYPESEYAYIPDLLTWYRVRSLDDTYYIENDDDDEEAFDSITINPIGTSGTRGMRHVINDNGTEYNLLTIELDEASELFK